MRSLLLFYICRSPDCFGIGWPMRQEDHDFFFVKTKDKPHFKNALVVSPDQKKEKKKSKKEEKKVEEDAQVVQ